MASLVSHRLEHDYDDASVFMSPLGAHTVLTPGAGAQDIAIPTGGHMLMIQNTGSSANCNITFDGSTPTSSNGFKLYYTASNPWILELHPATAIKILTPTNSLTQYQWFYRNTTFTS